MLSDFTVKEKKDFRYRFYRALTVWSIGNALTSGLWAALMAVTISDLSWGTAIALAFSAYFAGNLSRLFSASIVEKFRSYRKTTIFLYFFQGIALITAALIFAFGQALGRGQPGLFFFFLVFELCSGKSWVCHASFVDGKSLFQKNTGKIKW